MCAMEQNAESFPVDRLITLYELGFAKLAKAVEGITQEQARLRPVQGKWSPLELVAHLAAAELFFTDTNERPIRTAQLQPKGRD